MQTTIEKIADILEKELEMYKELVTLSQRLTDMILDGDIKQLDKLLNVQQSMVLKLGRLESERAEAAKGLWREDLVLTEIIEGAEGGLASRLEGLLKELLEVVAEQKSLNDVNTKLIKTNLEYVQFTLGTLTGNKPVNIFDEKV